MTGTQDQPLALALVPGLAWWPFAFGGLAVMAAVVAVDRLAELPSFPAQALAWPTWPCWAMAGALMLQMTHEWWTWGRVRAELPMVIDAAQQGHETADSAVPHRWLIAAASRCLDLPSDATRDPTGLADGEATVCRAFFLETVRRRYWMRLVMSLALAICGLLISLYSLRGDTNFLGLRETAGAALSLFVAALITAVSATFTVSHAEHALQQWHLDVVGAASISQVRRPALAAIASGTPAPATDADTPAKTSPEHAKQDDEFNRFFGTSP